MIDRRGRKGEIVGGGPQLRGPAVVHLRDTVDRVTVFTLVRLKLRNILFLSDFTAGTPFMFFVNKEEILPHLREKEETGPEVGNWGRLLSDGGGERRKWTLPRRW